MKRLGPQSKKLFEVSSNERKDKREGKKYTFILPVELMKKIKFKAIEEEKTISKVIEEALESYLNNS